MTDLIFLRYSKPLEALSEDWLIKCIFSVILAIWVILQEMFATKGELVILLSVAIFLDFVTGIIAAKRRVDPITSMGFRQSVVKIIEYTFLLTIAIGISNVFADQVPFIEYFSVYAFFFCIMTEFKSVIENVSEGRDSRVREIYDKLMQWLKKKNGIE